MSSYSMYRDHLERLLVECGICIWASVFARTSACLGMRSSCYQIARFETSSIIKFVADVGRKHATVSAYMHHNQHVSSGTVEVLMLSVRLHSSNADVIEVPDKQTSGQGLCGDQRPPRERPTLATTVDVRIPLEASTVYVSRRQDLSQSVFRCTLRRTGQMQDGRGQGTKGGHGVAGWRVGKEPKRTGEGGRSARSEIGDLDWDAGLLTSAPVSACGKGGAGRGVTRDRAEGWGDSGGRGGVCLLEPPPLSGRTESAARPSLRLVSFRRWISDVRCDPFETSSLRAEERASVAVDSPLVSPRNGPRSRLPAGFAISRLSFPCASRTALPSGLSAAPTRIHAQTHWQVTTGLSETQVANV
ncbi:hypothetical protein IEO21_07642 [Rhodonia placenta]|uniref:Uncharacterized protein n=1 Tax=Rhodonia placenta TaxID=104341 RepID=A0A8H7NXS5_9APHY|nr:hypothetical protein IEO21_07642 [Postia placenta]